MYFTGIAITSLHKNQGEGTLSLVLTENQFNYLSEEIRQHRLEENTATFKIILEDKNYPTVSKRVKTLISNPEDITPITRYGTKGALKFLSGVVDIRGYLKQRCMFISTSVAEHTIIKKVLEYLGIEYNTKSVPGKGNARDLLYINVTQGSLSKLDLKMKDIEKAEQLSNLKGKSRGKYITPEPDFIKKHYSILKDIVSPTVLYKLNRGKTKRISYAVYEEVLKRVGK